MESSNLQFVLLTDVIVDCVTSNEQSRSGQGNRDLLHMPGPFIHIRYPLTTTTKLSETGRNTFQPSRISWS